MGDEKVTLERRYVCRSYNEQIPIVEVLVPMPMSPYSNVTSVWDGKEWACMHKDILHPTIEDARRELVRDADNNLRHYEELAQKQCVLRSMFANAQPAGPCGPPTYGEDRVMLLLTWRSALEKLDLSADDRKEREQLDKIFSEIEARIKFGEPP